MISDPLYPPLEHKTPRFAVAELQRRLEGPTGPIRAALRALLMRPLFDGTRPEESLADHRDRVWAGCRLLAREGFAAGLFPSALGGSGDLEGYYGVMELVGQRDLNLAIKFGVQFGLWGGSLLHLGTEQHHREHLPDTLTAQVGGCFAMTEGGHGSNVRQLETTARFSPGEDGFIIDSPTVSSGKCYIGNAARHGRWATVFAQLECGGARRGIHAFLVPLRDAEGRVLPGIRIEDNGFKMGLNAVDNGWIYFSAVRIPRRNLLDRFGTVAPDGAYSSPIPSESARFFAMLGTLVGGRISIAAATLGAAKSGLAIAVRYAARRRQFGKPGSETETLLLDYPIHQARILPHLAAVYGLHFAVAALIRSHRAAANGSRGVETLAAAIKAWGTNLTTRVLQDCREATGGAGYIWANGLAERKADSDIFTTFEGDNTVLLQLVARNLLAGSPNELAGWAEDSGGRSAGGELLRERSERRLYALRGAVAAHGAAVDWNALQCEAAAVAGAWTENFIHCQLERAVRDTDDPEVRAVLSRLADLFAAVGVESDLGWFALNGPADRFAGVRSERSKLLAAVRQDALALIDSFALCPVILNVPIATE